MQGGSNELVPAAATLDSSKRLSSHLICYHSGQERGSQSNRRNEVQGKIRGEQGNKPIGRIKDKTTLLSCPLPDQPIKQRGVYLPLRRCAHLHNEAFEEKCLAGIPYVSVRVPDEHSYRIPCIEIDGLSATCPQYQRRPTP